MEESKQNQEIFDTYFSVKEKDVKLAKFVLDNYDKLRSIILDQLPVKLTESEYEYACTGSGAHSAVNKRLNFLLGREPESDVLTPDIEKPLDFLQQYATPERVHLPVGDFVRYSYVAIDSLLDFVRKTPLAPKRFAALGKLRGLRIARALQTQRISADDALAECEHSFGFTSI